MWCSPQEVYVGQAVSAGLNEVRYIIFAPLGQATARRVGVQLLDHILRLDLAFHLERQTGALSRILDRAQRSVVNIFRAVGVCHVLLFSLNFTCIIMLTTTQFWVWKLLIQSVQDVIFLEFSNITVVKAVAVEKVETVVYEKSFRL